MLESIGEFFNMGGYARYVWSAYAVAFVVLAANILLARSGHKNLVQRLTRERRLQSQSPSQSDASLPDQVTPTTKENG